MPTSTNNGEKERNLFELRKYPHDTGNKSRSKGQRWRHRKTFIPSFLLQHMKDNGGSLQIEKSAVM